MSYCAGCCQSAICPPVPAFSFLALIFSASSPSFVCGPLGSGPRTSAAATQGTGLFTHRSGLPRLAWTATPARQSTHHTTPHHTSRRNDDGPRPLPRPLHSFQACILSPRGTPGPLRDRQPAIRSATSREGEPVKDGGWGGRCSGAATALGAPAWASALRQLAAWFGYLVRGGMAQVLASWRRRCSLRARRRPGMGRRAGERGAGAAPDQPGPEGVPG